MSAERRPSVSLSPARIAVDAGQQIVVRATVKNTTRVLDAFDISVLGLGVGHRSEREPMVLSLFPGHEEEVELRFDVPTDYPAGEHTLWIKVSSIAEPAIDVVEPLHLIVATRATGSASMSPRAVVGGRSGRFGVTVHNSGNGRIDVDLVGSDDTESLGFSARPKRRRIDAGATSSFQVVVSGKRPLTGAAVPTRFRVVPRHLGEPLLDEDGQPVVVEGSFTAKPLLPMLLLAFAGAVLMLGLWAVVVGSAIDAVIDDSENDLAAAFEDGMAAVVGEIEGDAAATADDQSAVLFDVILADAEASSGDGGDGGDGGGGGENGTAGADGDTGDGGDDSGGDGGGDGGGSGAADAGSGGADTGDASGGTGDAGGGTGETAGGTDDGGGATDEAGGGGTIGTGAGDTTPGTGDGTGGAGDGTAGGGDETAGTGGDTAAGGGGGGTAGGGGDTAGTGGDTTTGGGDEAAGGDAGGADGSTGGGAGGIGATGAVRTLTSADGLRGIGVDVTLGAAGQADAAPAGTVAPDSVLGTVTAASDGRPIPGATVTVQAVLAQGALLQIRPDPNRDPVTAVSDDKGRFQLDALIPGRYRVAVTAAGYEDLVTTTTSADGTICPDVDVPGFAAPVSGCLAAGSISQLRLVGQRASLAGVVTSDGGPLADATVTVCVLDTATGNPRQPANIVPTLTALDAPATTSVASCAPSTPSAPGNPGSPPPPGSPANRITTAADGRFSFDFPAGSPAATPATFEIVVAATGFAPTRLSAPLAGGEHNIGMEIPISPPTPTAGPAADRVISGTVVQAGGAPLPGVAVELVGSASTYSVTTDAPNGSFRLEGVPAGSYVGTFTRDGFITATRSFTVGGVPDAGGADEPIELALAPGSLTGTVRNAATEVPLAGVDVTVSGGTTPPVPATLSTDVDGRYVFPELEEGAYTVTYTGGGVSVSGSLTIRRGEERVADVKLELPTPTPTGLVTGTILDGGTGRPLAGVAVTTGALATTTDAAGGFAFGGLAVETDHVISASRAGYDPSSTTVRLGTTDAQRTVTSSLRPNGVLAGTAFAVPPAGAPFASVTVTVTGLEGQGTVVVATDSATGRFDVRRLSPGEYNVSFSRAGFVPQATVIGVVGPAFAVTPTVALEPVPPPE